MSICSLPIDRFGKTAIMRSIVNDEGVDKLSDLLSHDASSVNAQDYRGRTALMMAAAYNQKESLERLIEYNADMDTQDDMGFTALFHAVLCNSVDCAQCLIDSGIKVDTRDECGLTALFFAVRKLNEKCVELLLNGGANRNIKDFFGLTAENYLEVMKEIQNPKYDKNIIEKIGKKIRARSSS